MAPRKPIRFFLGLFAIAVVLLTGCQNTDSGDSDPVLNIRIDKTNDSLLTFDTLIITVYSKDGSYSQKVFHKKLVDPKEVLGIQLDPRVGKSFKVTIIGYKAGKQAMNKEVTVLGPGKSESKDLPVMDTSKVDTTLPQLVLSSADTTVKEGDSLRLTVTVNKPWPEAVTFSLAGAPVGLSVDQSGVISWRPGPDQGRQDSYEVTIIYTGTGRKVEKRVSIRVQNVNRPPSIKSLADQKVKVDSTLSFDIEASDPDGDSLQLRAQDVPPGASIVAGKFRWKPSATQPGNYSIRFMAFDGSDSDIVAVLITVGEVDPPPALNLDITWPGRDTSVNITPIQIQYTVNGSSHKRLVGLKDGRNRVLIDTMVQSRTAFDTIFITLDTVPPSRPALSGKSPVSTHTPTWTWKPGGGGNGLYRLSVDDESMVAAKPTSDTLYTPPTDLTVGTHTLYLQEKDEVGNWSPVARHSIRIDTTRPASPTVASTPSSPTRNQLPTFTWQGTGDDIPGLFRYRLDNSDLRTGAVETKSTSLILKSGEELSEGVHTLYVQQQDSAGNWSNSGLAILRVDLSPPSTPQIIVTPASPTKNRKPTWSWSSGGADGVAKYRFRLNNTDLSAAAESGSALFAPDADLSEGTHILYVQERDSAGNWSQSASKAVRIDITPPGVPRLSAPALDVTNPRPTWRWANGGNGGKGAFRYKIDDPDLESGALSTTDTSLTPGYDLTVGERHILYIQESDSAGNWSDAASLTIRVHGQTGYGVGAGGLIYKTSNGGSTWDSLTSGTEKYLNSVFFTNATNGYVAGFEGTILKTTNGGLTWNPQTSGTGSDLTSIFFVDAVTGIAVGSSGSIIRTTNSGGTWSPVNSGTTEDLKAIHFTDSRSGYAAGSGGAILKTLDGGLSWKSVSFGSFNFTSIHFTDTSTGYAAGTLGAIVRTTNGGTSWQELDPGTMEFLYSVRFTSPTTGFAVGGGGIILKTSNGGSTWSSQAPVSQALFTVFFADPTTGYAAGNGNVFRTTNSGTSWTGLAVGTSLDFRGLFFP